jgi:hypothetical protein
MCSFFVPPERGSCTPSLQFHLKSGGAGSNDRERIMLRGVAHP